MSVSTVAHALLDRRHQCYQSIFAPPEPPAVASPAPAGQDYIINVLAGQWDETSQRVRALIATLSQRSRPGEITAHRKCSMQVMMTLFWMWRIVGETATRSQPYYDRGHLLLRQTADFLLEGVTRTSPWRFDSIPDMRKLAAACNVLLLCLCFDRASSNWSVASWIVWSLMIAGMPLNVLPSVEACWLHGIALVVGAPESGKTLCLRTHTLTCFLRFWKNMVELRNHMEGVVIMKCRRVFHQRPVETKAKAVNVIKHLFFAYDDEEADEPTTPRSKERRHRRERFKKDVMGLADVVDYGSRVFDVMPHYCYIEPDTEQHRRGGRVGCPCHGSDSDAIDSMLVPILNFFVGRGCS